MVDKLLDDVDRQSYETHYRYYYNLVFDSRMYDRESVRLIFLRDIPRYLASRGVVGGKYAEICYDVMRGGMRTYSVTKNDFLARLQREFHAKYNVKALIMRQTHGKFVSHMQRKK